ncbi:NYN domain-containing protein [Nonomuraea sp. 3-1Str]|uniref:NYN domain-containing protein n=1 Tax=Nonomuraea sp. 3-1Str TaxID=2929801 RepID=UPI00285955A6|nr:NYN domain-containing protein [Nonomuraea sp. 3-1Str]MDR8414889.1 NYN domain-containing protein [Nonomuraea sp. 3-1Str]
MGDKPNGDIARVGVYVDGYNLYYGLRTLSRRRDLWLDLGELARNLLRQGQRLQHVTYFTALVRADPDAVARQRAYLAALRGRGTEVVLGRFQEQIKQCRRCGATWRSYEEKKTDVAIASAMVADVALGRVDVVMLVSADSDLCAAVEAVREMDERRGVKTRVVSVFPPGKSADGLRKCSDAWFPLGAAVIRRSQLPDVVRTGDGALYHRPPHWN